MDNRWPAPISWCRNRTKDIELVVIAYIGLSLSEQVRQFVTINREAKGVPTSLYYYLLKRLPANKTESEIAKEITADIATSLTKESDSPFFQKITVAPPRTGQISLTNFVRKVAPLIMDKKGAFHTFSLNEQIGIIDNYYRALRNVFQHASNPDKKFSLELWASVQ